MLVGDKVWYSSAVTSLRSNGQLLQSNPGDIEPHSAHLIKHTLSQCSNVSSVGNGLKADGPVQQLSGN